MTEHHARQSDREDNHPLFHAGLHLHSGSLASRFGFNDGDAPDEVWDAFEYLDWHRVLVRLVREFLLPLCPDAEVYEISGMHNPIRFEEGVDPFDVGVTVPWSTVFNYCREAMEDA